MEGIARAARQLAIDGNHVLDAADLGRDDDPLGAEALPLGRAGALEGRAHQRLAQHVVGRLRVRPAAVLVHQPGGEVLVERAPVDADAHRPLVAQRRLDHRLELAVALVPESDIARVDAELGQGLPELRNLGQQAVAVVVKIADQRHVAALGVEPLADRRHGPGRRWGVDGDAHDLRAGPGQLERLPGGGDGIGRVRVGHRLDDDRSAAADHDLAHPHRHRPMPPDLRKRNHPAVFLPQQGSTGPTWIRARAAASALWPEWAFPPGPKRTRPGPAPPDDGTTPSGPTANGQPGLLQRPRSIGPRASSGKPAVTGPSRHAGRARIPGRRHHPSRPTAAERRNHLERPDRQRARSPTGAPPRSSASGTARGAPEAAGHKGRLERATAIGHRGFLHGAEIRPASSPCQQAQDHGARSPPRGRPEAAGRWGRFGRAAGSRQAGTRRAGGSPSSDETAPSRPRALRQRAGTVGPRPSHLSQHDRSSRGPATGADCRARLDRARPSGSP